MVIPGQKKSTEKDKKNPESGQGRGKSTAGYKLTGEQIAFILQGLAEFEGQDTIVAEFKDAFPDQSICQQGVSHYNCSPEFAPEIKKLRDKWREDLESVPIANKKVRLKALDKVFKELMGEGHLDAEGKAILLKTLRSAQIEREGLSGTIKIKGDKDAPIVVKSLIPKEGEKEDKEGEKKE